MTETINFNSHSDYEGGQQSASVSITGDDAGFLPAILEAFVGFLQKTGFTYLAEVKGVPGGFLILKQDANLDDIVDSLNDEILEDGPAFDFGSNPCSEIDLFADFPVPEVAPERIKVGDRVRLVSPGTWFTLCGHEGAEGTITGLNPRNLFEEIEVDWDAKYGIGGLTGAPFPWNVARELIALA